MGPDDVGFVNSENKFLRMMKAFWRMDWNVLEWIVGIKSVGRDTLRSYFSAPGRGAVAWTRVMAVDVERGDCFRYAWK